MSPEEVQLAHRVEQLELKVSSMSKLIKDLTERLEELEKPNRRRRFMIADDLTDKVNRSMNVEPGDEITFPKGPMA